MSFYEFLQYAGGPGVGLIVGFIISFLVEMWPWFNELDQRPKRLIFLALCFVIPLLAAFGIAIGGYAPWTFDPLFWQALIAGFAAAFGGTLAHTRKLEA